MPNHLILFRNDLRIHDHAPLTEALAAAKKNDSILYAAFIWSREQLSTQGAGPKKQWAYQTALQALSNSLATLGIKLDIITAPSWIEGAQAVLNLCAQKQVSHIHCHFEPGYDEKQRDIAFKTYSHHELRFVQYNDLYLKPPEQLLNKQGHFYRVFTAYKKALFRSLPGSTPAPLPIPKSHLSPVTPNPISLLDTKPEPNPLELPVTEEASLLHLSDFCNDVMSHYKNQRDFPALEGTSKLSTSLSLGTISSRQIAWELQSLNAFRLENTWLSEVIWREFYKYLLFWRPDLCLGKAFNEKWDHFPWSKSQEKLECWQQGTTGVPIVDAGMRQLKQTGWMHNRVRMITAMYLVKILQVDWRLGEAWFAKNLIDFDFASNNGGWQWVSSTGVDSTPYFRIFNPYNQSIKFDPSGHYIRMYVPEISSLSNKSIHEPEQSDCIQLNYPVPIVEYSTKRADTLAKFKAIRD